MRKATKSAKRPAKKSAAKKSVTKKPQKKLIKHAKTVCEACDGQGATITRKYGKPLMLVCKTCKGKGKIPIPTFERIKASKVRNLLVRAGAAGTCDHGVDFGQHCEECEEEQDEREVPTKVLPLKKGAVVVHTKELTTGKESSTTTLTDEMQEARDIIEERASFYGCPGKVIEIRKGPVVTMYEFQPAKTTRIWRLVKSQEDLALALAAETVMIRRIPGKNVMGIEISNEVGDRKNVNFRASLKFVKRAKAAGMELPLNLGTDPFGDPIIDDLAKMPHLLIAGSTGSGKSVSLNAIISSIIATTAPEDVQFYMIDPKGVELTHYNGIPHMKTEMVTSAHRAKDLLEILTREMRYRLTRLTDAGVRDIVAYNKLAAERPGEFTKMPRIICVIDELGDLMIQDKRQFTQMIAEISQIARATGIHMIAATQRPSVDVISGKIKVNFPGRIAFKVTSMADSKVIISRKGAESLLGMGDMLYLSPTRSTPIRIHAPWVPLEDVVEIADKIRELESARIKEEEAKREAERRERLTRLGNVLMGNEKPKEEEEDDKIELGWSYNRSREQ